MTDDRQKRLAQLRQAYESGILDEDTYRAAVAGVEAEAGVAATQTGSGGLAVDHSTAAGAGGIAVGGKAGEIHHYGRDTEP